MAFFFKDVFVCFGYACSLIAASRLSLVGQVGSPLSGAEASRRGASLVICQVWGVWASEAAA